MNLQTDGLFLEVVNAKDAAAVRKAMAILGKRKTPLKAEKARENGKLGGRPKEKREPIPA